MTCQCDIDVIKINLLLDKSGNALFYKPNHEKKTKFHFIDQ